MKYYHYLKSLYKCWSETSRSTTSSPRSDMQGLTKQIYSVFYEDIFEDLVKKAAIKSKGGCGPYGLDVDNCSRILIYNKFASSPLDLRTSIARFVKLLCNTSKHLSNSGTDNSLETLPLSKNPWVRPVGVGEVVRQIARKIIMYTTNKDVKDAAGSLQVWTGQESWTRSSHSCNIQPSPTR